ncbi:MAG: trigger factor [Verrucomicrobia bacterium]|nr:trigger factor [Verrucomicrobiota bacterium]
MNFEVENLPNCVASLRVEVPPERVKKEWSEVARSFRQAARIPGFRPGKAPQAVIEAKYRKEIQDELTRKLVSEGTREAIREKGLQVLSISQVEDVEFGPDQTMRFTATLITAPEFELPEYKGITVLVPSEEVDEDEVDGTLTKLRERQATFSDVEGRAVELDDFVILDYETTVDGQPLLEAVPAAPKRLAEVKEFWLKLEEEALLPGFAAEVVGMQVNETREFDLVVPESLQVAELTGRTLHFKVTLKAVKRMDLPALDEAFANGIVPGFNLAQLRETLKAQLQAEKRNQIENEKRHQIIAYLVRNVECELPQSYVKDETRRIVSQIVEQNQRRGVTEEVLRESQKDIVSAASRSARDRLKTNFILVRIAEKEGIKVTPQDQRARVEAMAAQHRTTYEKLAADLDSRGVAPHLREEILIGKVLDFLTSNANIETSSDDVANG